MCGLAGFVGNYEDALLSSFTHALKHRGPDGHGTWFSPEHGVGMAHTRLSIIDLSANSSQPMVDGDGQHVLTFNGEIYNYRALRSELQSLGHVFHSDGDSEVVLKGYKAWGHRVLERLEGIFAIALWDGTSKTMLLARDGFGTKPLYVARGARGFTFASELKALLAVPGLDRTLDTRALLQYLTFLWTPGERTMMTGVSKLRPGHYLRITAGRVTEGTFYELPFGGHREQPAPTADELRDLLQASVASQLVADVEVGLFLSGGVDSTALAAMAVQQAEFPRPRLAFTLADGDAGHRSAGFDADTPFARLAAKRLGLDLIEVAPSSLDIAGEVRSAVWHLDEPTADPAAISTRLIARVAREHGLKVLISGAGGDDVFTGYRRHRAIHAERFWSSAPLAARSAMAQFGKAAQRHGTVGRRIGKATLGAAESNDMRLASYFAWGQPGTVAGLLSSERRAELQDLDARHDLVVGPLPAATPLDRALTLEMRHFLADHNLNYTDKMAMAEGIEVRVPFLDKNLVAAAARLSDKQRIVKGEPKAALKAAVRGLVPQEILDRPKAGFGADLEGWLRGPLRPSLQQLARSGGEHGLFDASGVRSLLARFEAGERALSHSLLSVVMVEQWCEQFLTSPLVSSDNGGTR